MTTEEPAPALERPMSAARKPAGLIYGVDEPLPWPVAFLNGLQHVGVVAINLVYPLLVFQVVGAPTNLVAGMLSMGMFVLAAATFLQGRRMGPVGSGFMCPATFTATYLGPSLLAAKIGGLPLVFGMTIFAGILESALAPLLNRLRAIFPPEVSGLVIFIIGLSGGIAGLRALFGPTAAPVSNHEWIVGLLTLTTMVALNIWGRGIVRMICALIGLVAGYVAAALTGLIDTKAMVTVAALPWFGVPHVDNLSWSFDLTLVAPFAIASVAAAMKCAGTITVCQKMNDADWVRPNMTSMTRGVLADGVSTVIAGGFGALGINPATSAVGLAAATGVASRAVAYMIAAIFVLLGFFPKLPALLGAMPRPVIVAALLFAVSFIMINGLQIMASRLLDVRRTLIISLSILAGTAIEVFPSIPAKATPLFTPLVGSSLVLATITALALNFIFRIGVTRSASMTIENRNIDPEAIERFFQTQGARWGARLDIMKRASYGTVQLIDVIAMDYLHEGSISVDASFDEFNLDIRVSYDGAELKLPDQRPSLATIRESDDGARLLAGFMLRRNADRARSGWKNGRANVVFHFDH